MWINHNPVKKYNTDHMKLDTQWKTSYSYHCESNHLLVWIKIHIHSYAAAVSLFTSSIQVVSFSYVTYGTYGILI